jgi:hypothetical protein
MTEDPVVEEVRRVRKEISTKFGHDPKKYMQFLAQLDEELRTEGFKFAEPKGAKD